MNSAFIAAVFAAAFASMPALTATAGASGSNAAAPEIIAKYTAEPITMDGRLDEKAWAAAPAYSLVLPLKSFSRMPESVQKKLGSFLREQGTVKLLWNDNYLYVGAELEDSDVMNEGTEDQTHLYKTGDLIEVFLKPAGQSYYWEIYGTPNNKKTWFFFPGRGRTMYSDCLSYLPRDLNVAAVVDGTLNNRHDRDKGWSIEVATPIKELTALGAKFDNSANWTILLARYNYSVYFRKPELSACPQLSNANFHLCEEFARLRLEK